MNFGRYAEARRQHLEEVLRRQLLGARVPSRRLQDAMAYSALGGGKPLRAILAFAAAEALETDFARADIAACAVELVHAYSLIHDDLPAMDDDSLRRGRPTCHIAFDEATAILAGDALQALAFELLAASPLLSVGHGVRLEMIRALARAAGWQGMVSGQSLDFSASGSHLDEPALVDMHRLKTGALIRASVRLGALATGRARNAELEALDRYAAAIGLAFQIQDDILDVTSDTGTLGKEQGRDQRLAKPTYTSMLGLEGSVRRAAGLSREAAEALGDFGPAAEPLRELAAYVVRRRY